MNIYGLLRLVGKNRIPGFVKLLGLWGMHVTGRRSIGIFLDPVLACNLRCRMCLFSSESHRAEMKGMLDKRQLDSIDRGLFRHALKLQIGCGAEPTLYPSLEGIVERGKRAGIPYISLITNGQLIGKGKVSLERLVNAGLSEITISMHGTRKETYEYLMPGSDFSLLLELLKEIGRTKEKYPQFKARVNFTVNSMNVVDLEKDRFWKIWPEGVRPDIVQLRPVQNLGDSTWTDFDLTPLKERYDSTIGAIAEECRRQNIMCIVPEKEQLDEVATSQKGVEAIIEDYSYCYVSPKGAYKPDYDWNKDTFESYHRRHHTGRRLLRSVFSHSAGRDKKTTKKLNYTVK